MNKGKCEGCARRCIGCDNLVTMCKVHGLIENLSPDSVCKGGEEASRFERMPTLNDHLEKWYPMLADINYRKTTRIDPVTGEVVHEGNPRPKTVKEIVRCVRRAMAYGNIDGSESLGSVNERRLRKDILGRYEKELAAGTAGYRASSVKKLLECWQLITPRWMRDMMKDEDAPIAVPRIDIPEMTVDRKEWKSVDSQDLARLDHWMEELRMEGNLDWVLVSLMRATAGRTSDISRYRWDMFSVENGQAYITYRDSKTQRTAAQPFPNRLLGQLVAWRKWFFSPEGPNKRFRRWDMSDPFILPGRKEYREGGRYTDEKGAFEWVSATHSPVRKRCCRKVRELTCRHRDDRMGLYQLRAIRGNEVRAKDGEGAATFVMHNSFKMLSHYTEFDKRNVTAA